MAGVLCNDAHRSSGSAEMAMGITGDPTEAALLVVARKGWHEWIPAARRSPPSTRSPSMRDSRYGHTASPRWRSSDVREGCGRVLPRCLHMLDRSGAVLGLDQPRCSRWRMSWPRVACACWHSRVAPAMRDRADRARIRADLHRPAGHARPAARERSLRSPPAGVPACA